MPPYHNNSLWPWVAAYWAMANAKTGNEQGTLEAIGSVFRPAALFTTNKENFVLDNGDIATELNSSNMLWCLAGNLALTHKILFGIEFMPEGLAFHPFVPKALGSERSLDNFRYRNAVLDITVSGHGDRIKEFRLNGKPHAPLLPADIKGHNKVEIVMADNDIAPLKVNHTANVKAPLTPIARFDGYKLRWQSIEYIDHYKVLRNGVTVAETTATSYDASEPGEYQVIGVSGNGVESFASEPLSNAATFSIEMPGEGTSLISDEITYQPRARVDAYSGHGFVEVDHNSKPVVVEFDAPDEGLYSIEYVYANGNGPVNTENRCAIRTVSVDGKRLGTVVMPHRGVGNWNDWGTTNSLKLKLAKGKHKISLEFRPENENMNLKTNHAAIDRVIVKKLK